MTLEKTSFGLQAYKLKHGENQIQTTVSAVHYYLSQYSQSILLAFSKMHYQKCCRSWSIVSIHLEKFKQDPKNNYTLLMKILEKEMDKFSYFSFYGKQLKSLARFISSGQYLAASEAGQSSQTSDQKPRNPSQ